MAEALQRALSGGGASVIDQLPPDSTLRPELVAIDATGCAAPGDYRVLYDALHPIMRRIAHNGRVLIATASLAECDSPRRRHQYDRTQHAAAPPDRAPTGHPAAVPELG